MSIMVNKREKTPTNDESEGEKSTMAEMCVAVITYATRIRLWRIMSSISDNFTQSLAIYKRF